MSTIKTLPTDPKDRKNVPITSGVLDYFPDAVAAVAHCSWVGNEQHNPGQKLHWAKGKSTDHADCLVRHLLQRGTMDSDGVSHTAKVAWRALALLQTEIEDGMQGVREEEAVDKEETKAEATLSYKDAATKCDRNLPFGVDPAPEDKHSCNRGKPVFSFSRHSGIHLNPEPACEGHK